MITFHFFILVSICIFKGVVSNNGSPEVAENTLELLHVVFRHGDRTPDSLYPNDPYTPAAFYPAGVGELTNPGKVKAYNIGVALKHKYGNFLGDTYTPAIIEANSSPYSRCRATILAVLAALFPPRDIQVWNIFLQWQPIPYQYIPQEQNSLFFPSSVCPNYNALLDESNEAFQASGKLDKFKDTIDYLIENSGYTNISNAYLFLQLHSTFKSEEEWGLRLSPWAYSVWPEPLTTLAALGWEIMVSPEKLRILSAGYLMSKIVNDTYSKINNVGPLKDRKVILYSGHDSNIAGLLSWLGVFVPHSPAYGSYLTFEIHNVKGIRKIRIFHQNYSTVNPIEILIPGCGRDCRLDEFVKLYAQYFNTEQLCY